MDRKGWIAVCVGAVAWLGVRAGSQPLPGLFSAEERERIQAYWNAPGRYAIGLPPEAATQGTWQVRLTPEGSKWLLAYQKAVGLAKLPPGAVARGTEGEAAAWEKWVEAKVAWDRWQAQATADVANAPLNVAPKAGIPPPEPGLVPDSLAVAVGNPPSFASAVTPLRHTVTFDDGESFAYPDNVLMRARYAYYRFPQGTVAYGVRLKDMPDDELRALFQAAGFSESEQRIAGSVSKLEGGFETVNTYDTGYVSIGFIQFVTLQSGKESLSEVLQREKAGRPDDFQRDFRQYGVDVKPDLEIVCVDPSTGAELSGNAAVLKMVDDKRFAAAFQRAGRRSTAFRVAQIQVAKSHYWPLDDPVKVTVNGAEIAGKVSDVVKSEAGTATLFDRKVNRGTIAPFAEVLAKVMTERGLTTLDQAAAHEREIVAALKYRADFLADSTLSQPP